MIHYLTQHNVFWLVTACLSLIAALSGVLNQQIYSKVLPQEMLPGKIAQDAITILASLVLVFLSLTIHENAIKRQIVVLSLLAYLFYGYGVYVIARLYNSLYLLYMAICALAFWSSSVYGVVYANKDAVQRMSISKPVRSLSRSAVYSGFPCCFMRCGLGSSSH